MDRPGIHSQVQMIVAQAARDGRFSSVDKFTRFSDPQYIPGRICPLRFIAMDGKWFVPGG